MPPRRFILDTNCFIDASKNDAAAAEYDSFTQLAAPRLDLSSVVAAELRAGVIDEGDQERLETVLKPFVRRDRIITPSGKAWHALGQTLVTLVREDGLELKKTPRSFVFDILIAYSCREVGAILISANRKDLSRIAKVFSFDFVPPYPDLASL